MFEGFDWQPILIAAIGILSLVNGLSVLRNFMTDKPDVRVTPVYDNDWMYWAELKDREKPDLVRRYVMIGHMARSNLGRRPTSIAETVLRIRLRNRKATTSNLFDIPPPETKIVRADEKRVPVMKPEPDPFNFRPMLQSGGASAGIHCFLFGMYGGEEWSPQSDNGVVKGVMELQGGFGRTFKSDVEFRRVTFEALEALFPTLEAFMINNLDGED